MSGVKARTPGPTLDIGAFRLREKAYDPHERMPAHAHEHPSVSFVLAGALRESVGRREETAGPLSAVVKPAGVVHADAFGSSGARLLQIVANPGTDGSPWLGGWRWAHARSGVKELVAVAEAVRDASAVSERSLESHVWEVLATLGGRAKDDDRHPPSWLIRARQELDDRLSEGVEVRELAASAGVHPVSMTRAFKRHFGETVTAYRLRGRLRRAVALLVRGSDTISEVASECGFSDHAHFCRQFRRATGVSPSRYRRLTGRLPPRRA